MADPPPPDNAGPPWGVGIAIPPPPSTDGMGRPLPLRLHKRQNSCTSSFEELAYTINKDLANNDWNSAQRRTRRCFDDRYWFQKYPRICGQWVTAGPLNPAHAHYKETRKILQLHYTLKDLEAAHEIARDIRVEHRQHSHVFVIFKYRYFVNYQGQVDISLPAPASIDMIPAGSTVSHLVDSGLQLYYTLQHLIGAGVERGNLYFHQIPGSESFKIYEAWLYVSDNGKRSLALGPGPMKDMILSPGEKGPFRRGGPIDPPFLPCLGGVAPEWPEVHMGGGKRKTRKTKKVRNNKSKAKTRSRITGHVLRESD